MRILLITTSYPPASGSHTQRIIPMVNTLVKSGAKLFVLTQNTDSTWPSYDAEMQKRVDSSIRVFRAPIGKLHRFKNANGTNSIDVTKKRGLLSQIKGKLITLGGKIKKHVLLPDTMIDWYFEAINYERENNIVSRINPDVIVSCSMPNTVHLVSYKFSKKYNIPMYADIADPWAYIGQDSKKRFSLRFIIQKYLEKKVINHVVGSSYSAPGCRNLYIEKYQLDKTKTETVVTGFENSIMERAKALKIHSKGKKVKFTYGGAIQENVRDPKPFFKAAKDYEKEIELLLRTDDVPKVKKWLEACGNPSNILIEDYLLFDEYFKEMMNADIILFFGNNNDIQLPGKIFNCIATGKYILYLKSNNIPNDTIEQILSEYKRGIVVSNELEEIRGALQFIINSIDELRRSAMLDSDDISHFSEEFQFSKMYQHIEKTLTLING